MLASACRRRSELRLVLIGLLMVPAQAYAQARASMVASEILGRILHDNGQFVAKHDKTHFDPFREVQRPRVTLLTCSDSRLHTTVVASSPDGEIYMVRNLGNQVDHAEGSLSYGIRHLHTPLLLILGHVGCDAVKEAMGDYSDEPSSVRRELDGLHLSILTTHAQGSPEDQLLANIAGNVHQQVANAMKEFQAQIESGALTVIGAVYDFRDEYGQGPGRLVVVNINGEKDPVKVSSSPILKVAKARANVEE